MKVKLSRDIEYRRPANTDLLSEYNDLLAKVLVAHFYEDERYRASSTFNRIEAQTHLFELLETYIQLRGYLDKGGQVKLVGKDVIFYTMLIRDFPEQVEIDAGHEKFHLFIRFPIKLFFLLTFTLVINLVSKILCRTSKRYDVVIRSYFDKRSLGEDGLIRDEYFGPLSDEIARKKQCLVIFKLIHLKEAFLYFRSCGKSRWPNALVEGLIPISGIFKAFLNFYKSHITITEKLFYKGFDVTPLVQKALDMEYKSFHALAFYLEKELVEIVFNKRPETILMPFENQPWEKVYAWQKSKVGSQSRIIGFQHTGLSFKLVNYFPSKFERHLPQFPDRVVTVGPLIRDLLVENAFLPCPIVSGAALRHAKLLSQWGKKIYSPDKGIKGAVAYAFSYDIEKYPYIVKTLINEFGKSDVKVYLKFHPLYEERVILGKLEQKLPSNFILSSKISWSQIYENVDFVLYDDNSIGIEGMVNGIKTYLLDVGEPIYDCNRMFDFDIWNPTVDRIGLNKLHQELSNKTYNKLFNPEAVAAYIDRYYIPYKEKISLESFI